MKLIDQFRGFNKKKKIQVVMVGGIALGLVVGGSYTVYANQLDKQAVTQALTAVTKQSGQLDTLGTKLEKMMSTDRVSFLVKDLTISEVETLTKELQPLSILPILTKESEALETQFEFMTTKETKVLALQELVLHKLASQEYVNSFFQKGKAINGDESKKELSIVDNLKKETVTDFKNELLAANVKDEWEKEMIALVETAESQVKAIEKATQSVAKLYEQDTVKESATRGDYETAKKEVALIKNEKAKKGLEEKVATVQVALSAKEKIVADKQVAQSGGTVVENADGSFSVTPPVATTSGGATSQGTAGSSTGSGNTTPNGTTTNGNTSNAGSNTGGGSQSSGGGTTPTPTPTPSPGGSVTGNVTGGGVIDGGVGGGGNTWEGGDFDGKDIPDW